MLVTQSLDVMKDVPFLVFFSSFFVWGVVQMMLVTEYLDVIKRRAFFLFFCFVWGVVQMTLNPRPKP